MGGGIPEKTFNSVLMLSNVSFMTPFLQLITSFEVARKGHPKIIGICVDGSRTAWVSSTMKSTG